MKHSWHIERITTGRALQAWREAKPKCPLTEAARAAGVNPRRAKRILKYLEAHGAEPAIPEFGTLKHKDVIRMGFTGIEAVRSLLIRNHSAAIGLSRKTPRRTPQGDVDHRPPQIRPRRGLKTWNLPPEP